MTTTMTTSPYVLKNLLTYKKSAPVAVDTLWAKQVTSYQDLPEEFRDAFPETGAFPYTIYLPEEETGILLSKKRPAQLLSLYQDHLVVREVTHGGVSTNGYPLNAVTSLEHGRLLLQSWLSINNRTESATVMFNTVTEQLFGPLLAALRLGAYRPEPLLAQKQDLRELAKLSYLWTINLKYFNLARESILPGATIRASAYQPELELSQRNLLQRLGRSKSLTAHMAILTDRDLILIKEPHNIKETRKTLYGETLTYIPVSQIQHVSFQKIPGQRDWAMEVTLFDYTYVRAEFDSSTAVNWSEFLTVCRDQFGSRTN